MIFQQRILRQTTACLALFAVLLFLPGCPLSPDDDDEGPPVEETRLPDRTSAANAVEFYRIVWAQRLINNYTEVLHEQFQFFPRDDDAADFAWMQGESYGRTEELTQASNMFNPEFVDNSGSAIPARRVDNITMEFTHRSTRDLPGGITEITEGVEAFVWFNTTDALRTEAVFVFEAIVGPDGKWQIISQRERELL